MNLASRLKSAGVKIPKPVEKRPLWTGPNGEGPNGGVTQGLISNWLQCRERARVLLVDGLRPQETFNHRIEYGSMHHACEEMLARKDSWEFALREYAKGLCRKYPMQQEQVVHWMNVCRTQFPIYVRYWSEHDDEKHRTPLLQEQTFDVPYRLPSGRTVRLRGRWDAVDLIGKGQAAQVFLMENKTKGDIEEEQLKRQLSSGFSLQVMLYLVALTEFARTGKLRWGLNVD